MKINTTIFGSMLARLICLCVGVCDYARHYHGALLQGVVGRFATFGRHAASRRWFVVPSEGQTKSANSCQCDRLANDSASSGGEGQHPHHLSGKRPIAHCRRGCKRRSIIRAVLCVGSLLSLTFSLGAQTTEIKLATILPRGVGQDFILRKLAEDWKKTSGGSVELKLAPGAQKDGEAGIVKKLNSNNYQVGLLSVGGLSEVERDVTALQLMPLVFRDWDEVDFVREKIRGELEAKLRAKGYVVLFWADSGWVNYFSKEELTTPAGFKKTKMFAWAGNAEQVEIMKSLGY